MGRKPSVQEGWKKYLGERVINTEDGEGRDIPDIISGIILGDESQCRNWQDTFWLRNKRNYKSFKINGS